MALDRYIKEKDEYGGSKGVIKCAVVHIRLRPPENIDLPHRPFIIDLESTNGTHVNDEAIPASRYYELKPSDGDSFPASKLHPRNLIIV